MKGVLIMRDLQEYAKRAEEILLDLNIPFTKPISYTVNSRARRWGQCEKENGLYSINISRTLLDERNDEAGLLNTLLHELLHTCPGCMNHGTTWKHYAAIVRRATGLDIQRLSSPDMKGVEVDLRPVHSHEKKYFIQCTKCGHIFQREKKSQFVQHPCLYRCGCGGELVRLNDDEIEKAFAANGEVRL